MGWKIKLRSPIGNRQQATEAHTQAWTPLYYACFERLNIQLSKNDTASCLPLEGQPPEHSPSTSAQGFSRQAVAQLARKAGSHLPKGARFAYSGSLDADTSHLRAVLRKRFGARLLG